MIVTHPSHQPNRYKKPGAPTWDTPGSTLRSHNRQSDWVLLTRWLITWSWSSDQPPCGTITTQLTTSFR